jgi:DNA-binding NarL/FixJ family response regulator
MIRIAIVAESPVVRAELAAAIGAESDVLIISAAEDADVVLSVAASGTSRYDPAEREDGDLDDRLMHPPTILLLDRLDAESARDALAAGSSAVLPVDAGGESLIAALRAVAAGLIVVPSSVSTGLVAASRGVASYAVASSASGAALTPREREVLALLAQGLANKMIAPRLGITEHTVKTHVAAVYEKLHARNRAEAVVAAARQGLLIL